MRKQLRKLLKFVTLSIFTLIASVNQCALMKAYESDESISLHQLGEKVSKEFLYDLFSKKPNLLNHINDRDSNGNTLLIVVINRFNKNPTPESKHLVHYMLFNTAVDLTITNNLGKNAIDYIKPSTKSADFFKTIKRRETVESAASLSKKLSMPKAIQVNLGAIRAKEDCKDVPLEDLNSLPEKITWGFGPGKVNFLLNKFVRGQVRKDGSFVGGHTKKLNPELWRKLPQKSNEEKTVYQNIQNKFLKTVHTGSVKEALERLQETYDGKIISLKKQENSRFRIKIVNEKNGCTNVFIVEQGETLTIVSAW